MKRFTGWLPRTPQRRRQRRGAMVVMIAFMLVAFLVTLALSIDIAYMQLARTELRTATDAATRAAGEALSRTEGMTEAEAIEFARQAAKDIAAENSVASDALTLDDEDIVFGKSTRQEDGSWVFDPDGTPVNAVRVFGNRTEGSASGPVQLLFGKLFGTDYHQPRQRSTVVRLDRDLCLVVDRSSSMKLFLDDTDPVMSTGDARFCQIPDPVQSRWAALHAAVDVFVAELGNTAQDEHVGLVSYASVYSSCSTWNGVTEINLQIATDPNLVSTAIDTLSARIWNGNTNISAGIDSGVVALTNPETTRPFAAKTMVLFTDGHATQGRPVEHAAADAADANIVIHTVTFGDGANQADMIAVADITGGNHYHAPDAATLQNIFAEIALTLPIVFTE